MQINFAARILACSAILTASSMLSAAQQTPPSNPDASGKSAGQSSSSSQEARTTPPAFGRQPAQTPATAQNGDTPTDPPTTTTQSQTSKAQSSSGQTSGTSNDRLFFTLPNFLTLENAGHLPPLTVKQKFAVVARGSFDYVQLPWYTFLSGISQAEDSEPGYGQGAAGYEKRVGAAFADGTLENFMTQSVLPSIGHQDPRYYQLGKGSFIHRTFYAASRNIITRGDSGKEQFNYSEILGGALSAAISTNTYHPKAKLVTTTTPGVLRFIPSDRTLSNTAKVWGTQYGYDTITLVVKEFWPDIRRWMVRKHEEKMQRASH